MENSESQIAKLGYFFGKFLRELSEGSSEAEITRLELKAEAWKEIINQCIPSPVVREELKCFIHVLCERKKAEIRALLASRNTTGVFF